MRELLQSWGCSAITAADGQTALVELARAGRRPTSSSPTIISTDGFTGVAAVEEVRAVFGSTGPGADHHRRPQPGVLDVVRRHGIHLLKKPVKPAKLRALDLAPPGARPAAPGRAENGTSMPIS